MRQVDNMPRKRNGDYIQPERVKRAGFQDCWRMLQGMDDLLALRGLELIVCNSTGDFEFQIVKRKVVQEQQPPLKRYRGPEEVEPGA